MLHVARDKRYPTRHDLGSVLCLNVLSLLPPDTVQVREWDDPHAPRPTWLVGTPTLVTPNDEIYRGHQALAYLQRLAVDLAKKAKPAATAPSKSPPPPKQPAKRTAPRDDEEEEEEPAESLWESRIGDGDVEDDEPAGKVTSEDLARAMRAREQARNA